MSLALHWFRSDLRLHDNTSLMAASTRGQLAALYIATPMQWQEHDDAAVKLDYWRRNLLQLQQQLEKLGIPLLYAQVPLYRDIPELLEQLLPALKITSLHCNREYPVNEHRRDQAVLQRCSLLGIRMQIHDDQTLLPPEAVLNQNALPYKVFTPFAKTVRTKLADKAVKVLSAPKGQQVPVLPQLPGCCTLQEITWPAARADWKSYWPVGAATAYKWLQDFTAGTIQSYQQKRDFPASAGTSKLSPALAAGVLSVRQCWTAASLQEANQGTLTWQNELLWRDFYKHVMWHFPRVCKKLQWREDMNHIPWRHDRDEFNQWCDGNTGIPIVDAAMRQLLKTGWMHNRLRMISAMFLSKHLLIDWRWGEAWFMQHLVDGDFSANNGGWQWSASTGTDAAPYFRIFNPHTQSQRFDPQGVFIRQWVPELAELDVRLIHEPGMYRPQNYSPALLDLAFGRQRALNAFKK